MASSSSTSGGVQAPKFALAHTKALLDPMPAGRSPLRRVSAPFSGSTADARCLEAGVPVTALIRQFYVQDKIQWYEKLFGENEENLEEERRKNSTLKQLLKHKEDRIEMLEQENAKLSKVHSKAEEISQQIEEMEVETKYQEKVVEEMEEERETREHRIQYLEEKASSVRSRQLKRARQGEEIADSKLDEIERQLAQEIAEKEEYTRAVEKERQRLAKQQDHAMTLELRLEEMEAVLAAVVEEKQDLQQRLKDADTAAVLPREPSIQVDMAMADGDIEGILSMVAAGLQQEGFQPVADRQFSEDDVYFSDVESMSECDSDCSAEDMDELEEPSSSPMPRCGSRLVTARLMGEIANQSTAALATLEGTIMDTIQSKNTQIITTKMELNALRDRLHTALEAQAKNEEHVISLQAELQVCEKQVDRLESQVEEHKEQERLLMRKETERLRNEIATLQKETAERTYDIINLRKGIRRSISTLSRDVHEQVALEYLGSLVDVQSFMEVCLNDSPSEDLQKDSPAAPTVPEPAPVQATLERTSAPKKKKKRHHHKKKPAQAPKTADENQPQVQPVQATVVKRSSRTKNITHSSETPAPAMLAKSKQRHSRTDNLLRHLRLKK